MDMPRHPRSLVLALALAVVAAGCGNGTSTERDETGAVVAEGEESAFALRVGDCLPDQIADGFSRTRLVPCDEPHRSEVYLAFDLPGGRGAEYPGLDAVIEAAQQGCFEAFEGFVGEPYETSVFEIVYAYPTEESWRAGNDREVLCLVENFDGTLKTGTARNARR